MIRIRYNNIASEECTIRPTPLVSIAQNVIKNGAGEAFGVNYSITLTGTLLASQGTPYANDANGVRFNVFAGTPNNVGPYGAFDNNVSHFGSNRPPAQEVPFNNSTQAILFKQNVLRSLFAQDGQRFEITDIDDNEPSIICFPRVIDISFTEGIYVDKCDFTITLEADTLLDKNLEVYTDGSLFAGSPLEGQTEAGLLSDPNAAFIQDYSDEWSIEVDDSVGESIDIPRTYRISHSVSATGKTHYGPNGKEVAWEQAKKFVQSKLANNINDYPNVAGQIGKGTISLVNTYGGFNHVRTEQLSESNGTYSVTENWILAKGNVHENYNISTSSSSDSPFISVTIDGSIKGLSSNSPESFGGAAPANSDAYQNALNKYKQISNNGQFGLTSDIFKRANQTVAVQLNSQPLSLAISSNEYTGELSYNLQFNNRPSNFITGATSENISVNDTYPGDVFASISVLGRVNGPVLQNIGGRTEYRRDVSLNLVMDYRGLGYEGDRQGMLLTKPSLVEPSASEIKLILTELSPQGEPDIRKFFLSPPSESWSPKTGEYSISMSWTYELGN